MAAFFHDIRVDNDPTSPTHTMGPQTTTGHQPTQTTAPQPNNEFEDLLARSTETLYPEDDQDVIHGGTSSDVALSNEISNLDDTILNTNNESTKVDVPLDTEVHNDDDDFIYEINVVAHDIGFDDEVDLTHDEFSKVGLARIDVVSSDEDD
ncbi:hypothetical protein Tco_1348754 [Tanacetum coccineum]